MKGNTKLISGLVIAALILVVAVVFGLIFAEEDPVIADYSKQMKVEQVDPKQYVDPNAEVDLGKYYKIDMSGLAEGSNAGSLYIVLNDDGTSSFFYGAQIVGEGSYSLEGNELTIGLIDGRGTEMNTLYIVDGGRLINEDTICSGDITAGEVMDQTCYQKTASGAYHYVFTKDGSFTLIEYTDGGKDENGKDRDDKESKASGTYAMNGDYVETYINDLKGVPYLIYQNHLVSNFYEEISEEQYTEEMEANTKALEEQ